MTPKVGNGCGITLEFCRDNVFRCYGDPSNILTHATLETTKRGEFSDLMNKKNYPPKKKKKKKKEQNKVKIKTGTIHET